MKWRVWQADVATLQSIWKVPARNDRGELTIDDQGVRFEGKRSTLQLAPGASIAFVQARPRWGWVLIINAFALLLAGLAFGYGNALAGALLLLSVGFTIHWGQSLAVTSWVEIKPLGGPAVYFVATGSWLSPAALNLDMGMRLRDHLGASE